MILKKLLSTLSKPIIQVTPNAWTQISNILTKTHSSAFLFGARGGGCNGFNYDFKIISEQEYQEWINDKIKPNMIENGSSLVIIDPMSELLLMGTTIDYISNLYENKFTFTPDKNIASSCGCGVSFSPKK